MISGIRQKQVKSLALNALPEVSLTETRGGRGTIAFDGFSRLAYLFAGMGWPGVEKILGPRFEEIREPTRVYRMIRDAQKNAT